MGIDPISAIIFLFVVWVLAESFETGGDKKKASSSEGDFVDVLFSLLLSPIMLVVGALLLLGGGLLLLFPLFLGVVSLLGVVLKKCFSFMRMVLRKTSRHAHAERRSGSLASVAARHAGRAREGSAAAASRSPVIKRPPFLERLRHVPRRHTQHLQEKRAAGFGEEAEEQSAIMSTLRTIGWSTRHRIYLHRR